MSSLAKLPRAEQWAGQICAQLSKSAEAIVSTGRLLVKAKADLPPGEWGRMFEEGLVPFTQRWAQMLMAIAQHPMLGNTKHASYLPPSGATLYELTKLPDKTLDNAFRDGLITPSMERKEVKALMPPVTTTRTTTRSVRLEQTDTGVNVVEGNGHSITIEVEPEPLPDYTGHTTARRTPSAPSNGMQFARIAIMKLEEIRDDDQERQQAFAYVRSWLDARNT